MNVNVRGVFLAYKYALLRLMEQGKGGRIIGAASIAGKRGIMLIPELEGNVMLSSSSSFGRCTRSAGVLRNEVRDSRLDPVRC